jgi:hypothetical protein
VRCGKFFRTTRKLRCAGLAELSNSPLRSQECALRGEARSTPLLWANWSDSDFS